MDNFNSSIEEKRRYPRVESNLPLQYKNIKKLSGVSMGSLASNISAGGIRFKTNEFISLACRLVVEINLPTIPKPIKAISKVAWIRKLPVGEQYELGNQFLEIAKEDKDHITNFTNKLSTPNLQ